MTGRVLRYTARTHGLGYRALNRRLVTMMPPPFVARPIDVDPRRRKYVLPAPVAIGIRQLSLERARQRRSHNARSQISLELLPHTLHLNLERRGREPGKRTRRSLSPFPTRTMISLRSKSISFTRSWVHSDKRRPLPYMRLAHRRATPRIRERIDRTSPTERTTGNRRPRFAGVSPGISPMSRHSMWR